MKVKILKRNEQRKLTSSNSYLKGYFIVKRIKSGCEESYSNCASPEELQYLLFKIGIMQTVLFDRLYITNVI